MGGVFLLIFSFLYPLEKKQKIELEVVELKKIMDIQQTEIEYLKNSIDSLKAEVNPTLNKLEIAKKNRNHKEIDSIQRLFNNAFDDLKNKEKILTIKDIVNNSEKDKICLLKNHIKEFRKFQVAFLIVGPLFIIYGLYGWSKSVRTSEKTQEIQLKKLAYEQSINLDQYSLKAKILLGMKKIFCKKKRS